MNEEVGEAQQPANAEETPDSRIPEAQFGD